MLRVSVIRFLLFWGVWLLVPLAIDGATALAYLWASIKGPAVQLDKPGTPSPWPKFVSVIVPVHNAQDTLYDCLKSLALQNYPMDFMEVVCVGNGVTDRSRAEFARAKLDFPYLNCSWIELTVRGKSRALNAGAIVSCGEIIINLDADARLRPNAVSFVVRAFEQEKRLGAVCGSIHVTEMEEDAPWWWRAFNVCEIMEYLQAFRIGRRYQTYRNSIFTLSGAFSAFRREVLLKTYLYDDLTVSEDTKLTFDIRKFGNDAWMIGCIEQAEAFVDPVRSLSKFFAQRLRWQRGEIEVLSLHPQVYMTSPLGALRNFAGRLLISDHTLAIPRLTWLFLIPFLRAIGYPMPLIALAVFLTYLLYVVIEAAFQVSVRNELKLVYGRSALSWWYVPFFMPLYRFFTYWCRLAGIVYALAEPAEWSATGEWEKLTRTVRRLLSGLPFTKKTNS